MDEPTGSLEIDSSSPKDASNDKVPPFKESYGLMSIAVPIPREVLNVPIPET